MTVIPKPVSHTNQFEIKNKHTNSMAMKGFHEKECRV